MKAWAWTAKTVILASAALAISGCAAAKLADETSSQELSSYYRLISNLTETRREPVAAGGEDQLLVDPSSGAAGLRFGQGVDDIVGIWGKPDRISMDMGHIVRLWYLGGLRFTLESNRLYEIHVQGLPGARFKDGPSLDAGMEEIQAFLGEPVSESRRPEGFSAMAFQLPGRSLQVIGLGGRRTAVTLEKR
jgi:hypothetical protein